MKEDLFRSYEDNQEIKKKISSDPVIKGHLKDLADEAMNQGPWSVTYCQTDRSKGGPHDYYSEGPYWWPDPEKPDGPYIRRDGEFNPEQFTNHKMSLRHMSKKVLILTAAGYHLDVTEYIDYAMKLIGTWFLDEATMMNPDLTYAQAIPGICDGRGIGLIDTIYLVEMLHGLTYVQQLGLYSEEIVRLKLWFSTFLDWMCTSQNGIEEKENGNNHATWWTLQVLCYARFVGNSEMFDMALDWFWAEVLPGQMATDGSFPLELERTRSFHYSIFNLMPMMLIAEVACHQGVDLWQCETVNGLSIRKGVDFLMPYLSEPGSWSHPSLDPLETEYSIIEILAKLRCGADNTGQENLFVIQNEAMTKMMLPLYIW